MNRNEEAETKTVRERESAKGSGKVLEQAFCFWSIKFKGKAKSIYENITTALTINIPYKFLQAQVYEYKHIYVNTPTNTVTHMANCQSIIHQLN